MIILLIIGEFQTKIDLLYGFEFKLSVFGAVAKVSNMKKQRIIVALVKNLCQEKVTKDVVSMVLDSACFMIRRDFILIASDLIFLSVEGVINSFSIEPKAYFKFWNFFY